MGLLRHNELLFDEKICVYQGLDSEALLVLLP